MVAFFYSSIYTIFMNITTLKSDSLLLLTAAIWGFAFVAQRVGMDYVGPFTFNGVRFALGSLVLVPLILRNRKNQTSNGKVLNREEKKVVIFGGAILSITLFAAASLQQVGLVYTTAGNAGFITGLYVVLVPILGLFWKQRPDAGTWIGAFFAVIGLYFLSITDKFTISFGDLLELFGAFLWAGHVLIIGWLSPKMDSLKLACTQFTALLVEKIVMKSIFQAAIPILYGGALSVGVAYTLQVVAQKKARPAHAAIILSLEAVFAAFGGWLILDETLTFRGIIGCALMLTGMLLSQLWGLYGDGRRSLIGQELK